MPGPSAAPRNAASPPPTPVASTTTERQCHRRATRSREDAGVQLAVAVAAPGVLAHHLEAWLHHPALDAGPRGVGDRQDGRVPARVDPDRLAGWVFLVLAGHVDAGHVGARAVPACG